MKTARFWLVKMWRFALFRALLLAIDVLPRGRVMSVCRLLARIELRMTRRAGAFVAEAQSVLGYDAASAREAAFDKLVLGMEELVDLRRASSGREDLAAWTMTHVNFDPVEELVRARKPFVLALAHFGVGPLVSLAAHFPDVNARVAVNEADANARGGDYLTKKSIDAMLRRLGAVVRPNGSFLTGDGASGIFALRKVLRDGVAVILIDAPWNGERAHARPFAGDASRSFALGATHLARIAHVPVVLCVPERLGDTEVRLHWGPLMPPPARDDEGADVRHLDLLLDELERWIGRLHRQYPHPLGWERRWDAVTQTWTAIPSPEESAVPGVVAAESVPARVN